MTLNEFISKYPSGDARTYAQAVVDNITKYPTQNVYDALYKEYKDETGGQYSTEKLAETSSYFGSILGMSGQDFIATFEALRATYNGGGTLPSPAPTPIPIPRPNPPVPIPKNNTGLYLMLAAVAGAAYFFFFKKKR